MIINVSFLVYLDGFVQRRIELRAQYEMKCSRLDDKITRSTVQDTADGLCAGVIDIISDKGNTKA